VGTRRRYAERILSSGIGGKDERRVGRRASSGLAAQVCRIGFIDLDESPCGAFDTFYNFPALKVDYVPVDSPVPSGAWRVVEYPSRVFAREAFLDEVAHELATDPLELRIELLRPGNTIKLDDQVIDRARMIRVLEVMREKSQWGKPFQISGRLAGRGLAINIYDAESYMAQVAEVSLASDFSDLRVHRMVCVFDCGLAINPAGLEGQVESGITWGLSTTLHGKIDFRHGTAQQSGYHDFRVVRVNLMLVIETYIVASSAPPGGFGEHAVPHVASAVVIFSRCYRPASVSDRCLVAIE
jgi:isoquinoline 1-oxidoreductase beta subunit